MPVSQLTWGTVTGYDIPNNAVFVQFQSGGPSDSLPVLVHGANDLWRTHQVGLPLKGTRVLVGFPYGDDRGGTVLGSVTPSLQNAFTTQSTDHPATKFRAAWSGFVDYEDGKTGARFLQWPDGTTLGMAPSGVAFPTLYQTVATTGQVQQKVPVTLSQRTSGQGAVLPYTFIWNSPTGASAGIDHLGNATLTAAPGASGVLTVSGGASVTLLPNGNVVISAPGLIQLNASGQVQLFSNSQITASAPVVSVGAETSVTITSPQVNLGGTGGLAVKRADGSNSTTTFAV